MRIAGLAVLCALTLVAPALLLVWMPLVLGVPHIASDLRYLVLPLPRWQVITAVVSIALLVGLKAVSIATGTNLLCVEILVVAGWLIAAMRGRQVALGLALCASAVIIALPIQFAVVAAFAHNFVALVAWVVVAKPARKQVAALVTTVIAAVAVVALAGPVLAARTGLL